MDNQKAVSIPDWIVMLVGKQTIQLELADKRAAALELECARLAAESAALKEPAK